jgi:hypothetical protein
MRSSEARRWDGQRVPRRLANVKRDLRDVDARQSRANVPQGQGHTVLEQTWKLLRQLTKDRDLVTACVFAGVGLLASLSLAISWPA